MSYSVGMHVINKGRFMRFGFEVAIDWDVWLCPRPRG